MKIYSFLQLLLICNTGIAFCQTSKKISLPKEEVNIASLKLLGEYEIPYNFNYNNTVVGGLSGIDYDAINDLYYFVSDDKGKYNPARFYTAKILFTDKGIDSVAFTSVTYLQKSDGNVYPNQSQDPYNVPDPEGIRYNPITKQLVWSNEGERSVSKKQVILQNPSLVCISTDGKFIDSFSLPSNLIMKAINKGPRQNGVLEGLTFSHNYKTLFSCVEEPLYEDGPRADVKDKNTYIRIFKFDTKYKKCVKQFAYKLEPVANVPVPEDAFKVNGVSDILSMGNGKLLTVERSYSTGRLSCTIKVFIADFKKATDVKHVFSLQTNTDFMPATKKMILNMDDLGIFIDNIEGVTFGPILPNGHKTLLFVADNNFNVFEKSQVLLFEVME